ncbi:MAG: hypothetical protein KIT69_13955, partial [Propionibacteriaceae bacterium]|nr:hypothetical protein [Propionibacteriaceae bacterium]
VGGLVGSAIVMYRYVREITDSPSAGFLAAAIYVAVPYHIVDVWMRHAHGEMFAFVFIPLVFHGLHRLVRGAPAAFSPGWIGGVLMLGSGTAGLVLTHLLSTAMAAVLAIGYLMLNARLVAKWRVVAGLAAGTGLGLALSAVFLLPLVGVYRVGIYNVFSAESSFSMHYAAQAPSRALAPAELLFRNPGAITADPAWMTTEIGWFPIAGALVAVLVWGLLTKVERRVVWQCGLVAVLSLAFASSLVPWAVLPRALWAVQFPFRFLLLATFSLSIVGGTAIAAGIRALTPDSPLRSTWRRLAAFAVALGVLLASSSLLAAVTYRPVLDPESLTNQLPESASALAKGEYLPTALDSPDSTFAALLNREPFPVPLTGKASVSDFQREGSRSRTQVVTRSRASVIEFPLVYYPGYTATLDTDDATTGLSVRPSVNGFVSVRVPAQKSGELSLQFGMTRATVVGVWASGVAVLVGAVLAAVPLIRRVSRGSR